MKNQNLPSDQPATASAAFDTVRANRVIVGGCEIAALPDGGAGVWIGKADEPQVAIFLIPDKQVGIGIYAPGRYIPSICLTVGPAGEGLIQFSNADETVTQISLQDLVSKQVTEKPA